MPSVASVSATFTIQMRKYSLPLPTNSAREGEGTAAGSTTGAFSRGPSGPRDGPAARSDRGHGEAVLHWLELLEEGAELRVHGVDGPGVVDVEDLLRLRPPDHLDLAAPDDE